MEWAATQRTQALAIIARARAIIEETRSRILSPEIRSSYFATKRSIYDFEISKLLATKRKRDARQRQGATTSSGTLGPTAAPAGLPPPSGDASPRLANGASRAAPRVRRRTEIARGTACLRATGYDARPVFAGGERRGGVRDHAPRYWFLSAPPPAVNLQHKWTRFWPPSRHRSLS